VIQTGKIQAVTF